MTWVQGAVLGVVQGLTEFLPISSSGHLILVPHLLAWPDQGLAVDAALHLGTLAALVAYFRAELLGMLTGGYSRRLGWLLLAATVPAGVAGLALGRAIEEHLRWPGVVAASLAGWALVMWLADRRAAPPPAGSDPLERVSAGQVLAVGVAQALALIPGTSRSGITITAALLLGLDRSTAARLSFMLGIPVTGAAGALKTLQLARIGLEPGALAPLLVGLLAAFVSGWFAVWFLVTYLRRGSLLPFVVYRLFLAAVIVVIVLR